MIQPLGPCWLDVGEEKTRDERGPWCSNPNPFLSSGLCPPPKKKSKNRVPIDSECQDEVEVGTDGHPLTRLYVQRVTGHWITFWKRANVLDEVIDLGVFFFEGTPFLHFQKGHQRKTDASFGVHEEKTHPALRSMGPRCLGSMCTEAQPKAERERLLKHQYAQEAAIKSKSSAPEFPTWVCFKLWGAQFVALKVVCWLPFEPT